MTPSRSGKDLQIASALDAIVVLLGDGIERSGRAIKAALAGKHRRAAVESALVAGVKDGRLYCEAGSAGARLYSASERAVPPSQAVPEGFREPDRVDGPAVDGVRLTRRELAERLGLHMQTITGYERDGMPISERGRKGKPSLYSEVDVRAWLAAREEAAQTGGVVDVARERARKDRAQAILAEQTYQIRAKELLPRVDVEKAWSAETSAVRTKLLSWPTTIADKVHRAGTLNGVAGVEAALRDAVEDVLRELADPNRVADDDEDSGDGEQESTGLTA